MNDRDIEIMDDRFCDIINELTKVNKLLKKLIELQFKIELTEFDLEDDI